MFNDWHVLLSVVIAAAYVLLILGRIRAWLPSRKSAGSAVPVASDSSTGLEPQRKVVGVLSSAPDHYDIAGYKAFGDELNAIGGIHTEDPTLAQLIVALSRMGGDLAREMPLLDASAIMDNSSLAVRSYANGQFTTQFPHILKYARQHDFTRALERTKQTQEYLQMLGHIRTAWEALRIQATNCILEEEEVRAFEGKFAELRHGEPFVIFDPVSGRKYGWNSWLGLVSPARKMGTMAELVGRLLQFNNVEADVVSQLSVSGGPFAQRLADFLDVEHHAIDNDAPNFAALPDKPVEGRRYILVDSMIRTGSHLLKAVTEIEEAGATVEKAVFLVWNDLLPQQQTQQWMKGSLAYSGKVVYLFEMSDLIRVREIGELQHGAAAS